MAPAWSPFSSSASSGLAEGAVNAADGALPAGVAAAPDALAEGVVDGVTVPVAPSDGAGLGAWVGTAGWILAAATASTCRNLSSAVVPTSLMTSSWPLPGTEMMMLSPDLATSASEMPVPLTRSRMMLTAWSRLSCGGVFPVSVTGDNVTVVPPAKSRPYWGVNAFCRKITPPMARMSTSSARRVRPGRLWLLVGGATGRRFLSKLWDR